MKYKRKKNTQVNIQVGVPSLAVIGDSTPTSRQGTSLKYNQTIESREDEKPNATC